MKRSFETSDKETVVQSIVDGSVFVNEGHLFIEAIWIAFEVLLLEVRIVVASFEA